MANSTLRRIILTLAATTFVIAGTACGKDTPDRTDRTDRTDPPARPDTSAAPAPAKPAEPAGEWKTFTSTDGRYSISMPGVATETAQTAASPLGAVTMHIASVDRKGTPFVVMYNDLLPGANTTPEVVLDGQRDGSMSTFPDAKIISDLEITIDAHPGRALMLDVPSLNGKHLSRTYLVDKRLYTLVTMELGAGDAAAAATFFDSFRLTK
jgi:hypothetical protein